MSLFVPPFPPYDMSFSLPPRYPLYPSLLPRYRYPHIPFTIPPPFFPFLHPHHSLLPSRSFLPITVFLLPPLSPSHRLTLLHSSFSPRSPRRFLCLHTLSLPHLRRRSPPFRTPPLSKSFSVPSAYPSRPPSLHTPRFPTPHPDTAPALPVAPYTSLPFCVLSPPFSFFFSPPPLSFPLLCRAERKKGQAREALAPASLFFLLPLFFFFFSPLSRGQHGRQSTRSNPRRFSFFLFPPSSSRRRVG